MHLKKRLGVLSCLAISSLSLASVPPAQQNFVDLMVNKHQFNANDVTAILAKANKDPKILQAIKKPWEAKPWHKYYPIFLTEKRLTKGLAFWQQHQQTLAKADQQTGVPAHIIVAIIGIESYYGTYTGKYSVLDALVTLGFHYPPRARFFQSELAQLFLLGKEEQLDIAQLRGSYAGAMGWGQFIPSSYRHYGVDFDQDGHRDLFNNPADAIGSVANYFSKNGWKRDHDVAFQARVSSDQHKTLITRSRKLTHTWEQLIQAGVTVPNQQIGKNEKVKLLAFEQPDGAEYWVGLKNFAVIMRYNHNPLYAMAVFQFSQQLKAAFKSTQAEQ